MKAKFLVKINVLLGILAMFFAGCHSHAKVVRDRGPVAKYGVPQEVLDQQRAEQQRIEQQQADSAAMQQAPAEQVFEEVVEESSPTRQPKKYGPPHPRN